LKGPPTENGRRKKGSTRKTGQEKGKKKKPKQSIGIEQGPWEPEKGTKG